MHGWAFNAPAIMQCWDDLNSELAVTSTGSDNRFRLFRQLATSAGDALDVQVQIAPARCPGEHAGAFVCGQDAAGQTRSHGLLLSVRSNIGRCAGMNWLCSVLLQA
jgi:hypothetical protein